MLPLLRLEVGIPLPIRSKVSRSFLGGLLYAVSRYSIRARAREHGLVCVESELAIGDLTTAVVGSRRGSGRRQAVGIPPLVTATDRSLTAGYRRRTTVPAPRVRDDGAAHDAGGIWGGASARARRRGLTAEQLIAEVDARA
jgi:hypothetical protein